MKIQENVFMISKAGFLKQNTIRTNLSENTEKLNLLK